MSEFYPETRIEEIWTYTFLWHSMGDACPKCRSLNGQEFGDQDIYQKMLYSPVWGDLMDLDTGYLFTHPHCRCQTEVKAECNLKEISELDEYNSFLEMMI